jgi:hypothetical protein
MAQTDKEHFMVNADLCVEEYVGNELVERLVSSHESKKEAVAIAGILNVAVKQRDRMLLNTYDKDGVLTEGMEYFIRPM